jgi:hypothetical protein
MYSTSSSPHRKVSSREKSESGRRVARRNNARIRDISVMFTILFALCIQFNVLQDLGTIDTEDTVHNVVDFNDDDDVGTPIISNALKGEKAKNSIIVSDALTKEKKEEHDTTTATPSNARKIQNEVNDTVISDALKEDQHNSSTSFARYDGVVIATKVLWSDYLVEQLKPWLCLLSHAYNDKMNYDIVIFTTIPWDDKDIAKLQKIAAPANLTVAVEGPPLEEQLAAMSKEELQILRKRCGANETISEKLTWYHYCKEPGSKEVNNLGYAWQAEFRSYHIWNHPAVLKYKYMIWLDSDAYIGREWDIDPIQAMVENDLTVLYAGWPYGRIHHNDVLREKLIHSYNTSICDVQESSDSAGGKHIYAKVCNNGLNIKQLAGNHHITNMEVFRKDVHQHFLKNFTGDYRFSRMYDDQIAVTIVGLMEQYMVNNYTEVPAKYTVWHERTNGMLLKISHHGMYDAEKKESAPVRAKNLIKRSKANWTGLEERCGRI